MEECEALCDRFANINNAVFLFIVSLQDSFLKINVYFACDHLTIILKIIAITNIFLLLPFLIFLWLIGLLAY